MTIPSAKPYLSEEEVKAAGEAILSGWVTQGPRVKAFEEAFSSYVGCKYSCAVSNCTTGMHLALLAVGVKPGDVVITVSHSFIATANCCRYCGAEPVFVDIDSKTYNISVDELTKCLQNDCEMRGDKLFYKHASRLCVNESPLSLVKNNPAKLGRVAAILVVHQMGLPCDLKSILPLAKKFNVPVIEDAACAIGSDISFDQSKSWEKIGCPHGDIACFSFHPLKVITTGEGGMLTTNDAEYDRQLRLLRHQGMNISDLIRHNSKEVVIEEYSQVGYNYRMTDIQAAIGIEQLKRLPAIVDRRREIVAFYQKELSSISWLRLPENLKESRSNWQSFCVEVLDKAPMRRNQIMQHLRNEGILTRLGIMNAHSEPPYRSIWWTLPNSEKMRNNAMILPVFYGMKEEEMSKVVSVLKKI